MTKRQIKRFNRDHLNFAYTLLPMIVVSFEKVVLEHSFLSAWVAQSTNIPRQLKTLNMFERDLLSSGQGRTLCTCEINDAISNYLLHEPTSGRIHFIISEKIEKAIKFDCSGLFLV